MLVHDAPSSITFPEPHRKAKFEIDFFATAQITASAGRGCECYVVACRYSNIAKIELHRFGLVVKEGIPGRHIGVQSARQEWRRYVKHQDIGIMVGANSCQILFPDCLGPAVDQCSKFRFSASRAAAFCHFCHSSSRLCFLVVSGHWMMENLNLHHLLTTARVSSSFSRIKPQYESKHQGRSKIELACDLGPNRHS